VPLPVVVQAQLFRSTRFLSAFVLLGLSRFLPCAWGRGGLDRAGVVLAVAGLFSSSLEGLLLPGLLALLLAEPRGNRARRLVALGGLMAGAVWGGYRLELPTAALGAGLAQPAGWAIPLSVLAVVAGSLWQRARSLRIGLPVGLACLALLIASDVAQYRRYHTAFQRSPLVRLQEGMRSNTPPDAVLLTPPDLAGMRVYSERSVVVEWKDGTLQYYSQDFAREWYRRMQDLEAAGPFDGLGASQLQSLARRYGATHLVFRAGAGLPFPELHREGRWAVYRMPGAEPRATTGGASRPILQFEAGRLASRAQGVSGNSLDRRSRAEVARAPSPAASYARAAP
jgi:hypothetical protein